MVTFEQSVNAPQAASMTPPKVSSDWIGQLYNDFVNSQFDQQRKKINDQSITQNQQHIQQGQYQLDAARSLQGGVPMSNGAPDVMALFQKFLGAGDVDSAMKLLPQIQQQQGQNIPTWPQQGQSQQGQPAPQQGGQPQSIPAKPLPPVAANSPQGDNGQNTLTSLVTDRLPAQNQTTGATIGKIAEVMGGIDPNQPLTPGQITRAQGLLKKYAPEVAGMAAGGGSGNLPPSAVAQAPAPPAATPSPQGAPNGAGSGAQPTINPSSVLPNDPRTGKPIQDVQQARSAIDEINKRIDVLAKYPNQKGRVQNLEHQRDQIEEAIKPIAMRQGETLLDPSTRQPIYSAPTTSGGQAGQLVRKENAERAERGEPAMTAQEEISFIQGIHPPRSAPAMAVEAFRKDFQEKNGRAPTGDEIKKFAASYAGEQAYQRTAGSSGARVENAGNEVEQLIPQAVDASRNYIREGGKWVKLNEIYQAWDRGQSDEKYNDFMLANFGLINAYTRAMNPQGIPRIQERLEQHALGVLSTATSEKTYETQIRRLWKEVQASKTATAKTAQGRSPGDINSPVPGLDPPASAAGQAPPTSASGNVVKWGRGPDGTPQPVQ
jgi:hypothetical protein